MSKDAVFSLIKQEEARQADVLEMIASENYTSSAVREAVGSVFINKYAEGQAGARYYQGNNFADQLESLCKERALQLFELDSQEWGVNVQPYSGSPANLAVYNALLEPGDRIMAMYLPDGGHLSHGWELPEKKISIVSKFWEIEHYKTDEKTQVFDYDAIEAQAVKYVPKMIISGGTAYAREIDHKRMSEIARKVGAYYLADVSHESGLIAGKANASPFPYADVVMMTTHKTLRGPRGAMIFSRKSPLDLTKQIDFSVFPGMQGGPHLHTIAGLTVALGEAIEPQFKTYADQVVRNAQVLAEELIKRDFSVVSGGTDKHLVLIDLRPQKLSGWVVAWALEVANIIVNRNTVPYETASPFYPSGLRLGTPAITTRGMKETEMVQIAEWIDQVVAEVKDYVLPEDPKNRRVFVQNFKDEIFKHDKILEIKEDVLALTNKFPIKN